MDSERTLRFAAVGDIALNAGYGDLAREGKGHVVFTGITAHLAESDLIIGNLEGPLTECPSTSPPWRYCLRGNPSYGKVLRAAGFQVVSLANNHMMDYGWQGVEDTLKHLSTAGIVAVGAGRNVTEARRPAQITVNGIRVAVLAYCSLPVGIPLYATATQPGVARAHPAWVLEDIRDVRSKADLVLVCMHWGQEHVDYPSPWQRKLAKAMIDAGANAIIGHHPHVLQGTERIGEGIVAYSLGNFLFAEEDWSGVNQSGETFQMRMEISLKARQTAIFRAKITREGEILSHVLTPAYLSADLRVIADCSRERLAGIDSLVAVLSRPGYAVLWLGGMIRSRTKVVMGARFSSKRSFWQNVRRIRPRHLRHVSRILAREWEQLRGME